MERAWLVRMLLVMGDCLLEHLLPMERSLVLDVRPCDVFQVIGSFASNETRTTLSKLLLTSSVREDCDTRVCCE